MFQFLHPFAEGQDRTSWHRWTKGKVINFEMFFLKKMGQPRPLFCLFSSIQTNITNFTTNMNVKKCPSSIQHRDSNSQPSDYESPPFTTRPGLLPKYYEMLKC